MITPLGKHLRKWLLEAAVAVRNRVQTVVAVLESTQEEEAGTENAPGGAKKARPGGPPDHWVQLVERHAPELLQAGSPEVVSRHPSPPPASGAGLDGLVPESARELESDSTASAQGDRSRSSSPHRVPQDDDRPNRKQKTPTQVQPGQAGGNDAMADGGATSSDRIRGGAAYLEPAAVRPGPVRPGPSLIWPAGEDKTMHRQTLDYKRHHSFFPAREPATKTRAAASSNESSVVSRSFQSTGAQIENQPAGAGESKNIEAPEPTAGQAEPIYPKAPGGRTGSAGDARMPTPGNKQEAGFGTPPGPGSSLREMASDPNTGGKVSASQFPADKESVRPGSDARITGVQHHALRRQEGVKGSENTLPPAEPRWPSLSGEEESEDARGGDLTAVWPGLPKKQSAEATLSSNHSKSYRTTPGSRDMERLRRLEEEQKGRSWSASHF